MGRDKIEEKFDPVWELLLNRYQVAASSESQGTQLKASIELTRYSDHAPEHILARAIPTLAGLLLSNNGSTDSVKEAAVYCLKRIAFRGEGFLAREIGNSGAIPFLLRLLPLSNDGFQRVVIKCVWCLVNSADENRVTVARNGGLEIILGMLNSCVEDSGNKKWVYLLEIFSALVLLKEVRKRLSELNGIRFLIESAKCGRMKSRERACQAIGLLGRSRRARCILVDLGAIPVVIELFRDGNGKTKVTAGNSLGIISSHINFIRKAAEAGAIPLYADLIQGPDPIGKEIAEDALCILAIAEENAVAIADQLARILREGDDESKVAASYVFCNLGTYEPSASIVRNSGAISILVGLLRHGNLDVKGSASGVICQLSYDRANREALLEAGAVPILIGLLGDHSEDVNLRDNVAEALVNFSQDMEQGDLVAEVVNGPSFENAHTRVGRLRSSDEQTVSSLRHLSVEQLSYNPELV
ncbi:unnamed protein product [Linum tenue]|uniref:Uncharacterized protein n=1 Tax=Linum tenue TaxID=586396 RepID=A0AAV0GM51_9ROSI|nr:unnamed protein product [Linum tenue]